MLEEFSSRYKSIFERKLEKMALREKSIIGPPRVDILDGTVAMRFGSYENFSEEVKIFFTFDLSSGRNRLENV